jgi:hypothetical protein
MEAKGPVRYFGREAGERGIFGDDGGGRGEAAGKEVEVENTAQNIVLQGVCRGFVVDLDVHSMGAEQ